MPSRQSALRIYLAGISIAGLVLSVVLLARAAAHGAPPQLTAFLVLALLLLVTEQFPIGIQRRGGLDTVSLSGVFTCALVLQWDAGWAVAVQVLASLIDDVISRRTWWKNLFNAGQYTLAIGAAALVAHATAFGTGGISALHVAGALATGFTFFFVNNVLPGVAMALACDEPVVPFLLSDAAFQASVNGAMTVLAPVVVTAADSSVWLVPLLLVPGVAVYRAARVSLEKEHRARHDHLTDLPNRFFFTEVVADAIAELPATGELAVMVMDLDSFKELNDTLGHAAGDELLRQVGPRLQTVLPPEATLARLGGDEFAILLPALSEREGGTAVARSLLSALADSFEIESTSLDLHASVGIAVYPEHGTAPELLLQHADVAMYVAKRNRSGVEVYAAERNQHSRRRLSLLNELRPALTRGQLSVHYQPQVDMHTGMACGAEGLLRWRHPELGDVSPGEFIGLAEHTGFIRQLTEFVLTESIAQLHEWRSAGLDLTLSVNMSPHVLRDPALFRRLVDQIRDSALPPGALIVELTETAVMADPVHTGQLLEELATTGVHLSIDDFGTGYSALSYLSRLPVSELKIDRSFVTHIDTNDANRHIVAAITDLARNLGITVVAEGVERVAEWQTLAALGCHVAQGFLISRAMPAPDATELLSATHPLVETFALTFGVDSARIA